MGRDDEATMWVRGAEIERRRQRIPSVENPGRGMTQKEFGASLRKFNQNTPISDRTIREYESPGKNGAPGIELTANRIPTLKVIAQGLGVHPSELISGAPGATVPPDLRPNQARFVQSDIARLLDRAPTWKVLSEALADRTVPGGIILVEGDEDQYLHLLLERIVEHPHRVQSADAGARTVVVPVDRRSGVLDHPGSWLVRIKDAFKSDLLASTEEGLKYSEKPILFLVGGCGVLPEDLSESEWRALADAIQTLLGSRKNGAPGGLWFLLTVHTPWLTPIDSTVKMILREKAQSMRGRFRKSEVTTPDRVQIKEFLENDYVGSDGNPPSTDQIERIIEEIEIRRATPKGVDFMRIVDLIYRGLQWSILPRKFNKSGPDDS